MEYTDFLKIAKCGLIFVKTLYPLNNLLSSFKKYYYTHVGVYSITEYYGCPAIAINFIDLFDHLTTPSWYKNEFTLDELLQDKLVTNIDILIYKNDSKIFKEKVKYLFEHTIFLSSTDFIYHLFDDDNTLSNNDLIMSFIHSFKQPYQLQKHPFSLDHPDDFQPLQSLYVYSTDINEIIQESQSSLFIEKSNIYELFTIFTKMLTESKLRSLLTNKILSHNHEHITFFIESVEKLIKYMDHTMKIGELDKSAFLCHFQQLQEIKIKLENAYNLNKHEITINNIEECEKIKLTPSNNHRETQLRRLHSLLSSIVGDCKNQREHIKIPINDLVEACNQLCEGTEIHSITPLEYGSYGAYIVSNTQNSTFETIGTTFKLIPTLNANLDELSDEQLGELNQALNKNKNPKLNSLKNKLTRVIAERFVNKNCF
jgi:hypothetical protein